MIMSYDVLEKQSLSHLNFSNTPQLLEVVSHSLAQVTRVMVHGVRDVSCPLKYLCRSEALFMEALMVRAASACDSDMQLRAVESRYVGNELRDFWGANSEQRRNDKFKLG